MNMPLPTDNTMAGSNTSPILQYFMNTYGMIPPEMGGGILNQTNQRQTAPLSTPLPPAPNRNIGMNEAAIRIGAAGLGGAQKSGLQSLSDMGTMYGGIQDYNRSRALEDYNAKVTAMYRQAQAQKAMGAGKNKGTGSDATKQASSDVVFDTTARALDLINTDLSDDSFWNNYVAGSTGWASVLGKFAPTHPANQLNSLLTTLKGNFGFDKLQAMREASPTGGALGQVSNQELTQLNAAFGDLEQSLRPEELKYNLQLALHIYNNIIHGEGNHDIPRPTPIAMQSMMPEQQQDITQEEDDLVRRNLP